MNGVLLRKERDTQGECHVTTETEIAVTHLEAEGCQGWLADTRSRRQGRIHPHRFQKDHGPADTFTSVSRTVTECISIVLCHPVCGQPWETSTSL